MTKISLRSAVNFPAYFFIYRTQSPSVFARTKPFWSRTGKADQKDIEMKLNKNLLLPE